MAGSVIVHGARTPMGRLQGSLKDFSGADLGGVAIQAALERAGVSPEQVQYVIMGQVLQAGAGQIPARQAAVKAGIPMSVPALTVNKVCLSGLDAIALADQLIRAGEFDIVVAGGQESMTNAPHLLPKSRAGYKYGSIEVLDAMAYDGLADVFDHMPMGEMTDNVNKKLAIGREEQDEFSARSHQRAAEAQKNGLFDEEIAPVLIPQRKGDPIEFREDEGIRGDATAASLGKLRPAFTKDGTITAGSASQISDGACAVVVMSKAKAEELGLTWLAEIGAHGNVAGPDNSLQSQPANAIQHALGKEKLQVSDLDLLEINEAFAAVGVQSMKDLGDQRGRRERQRRRDRAGPPDRHVRCPPRPDARAGAQASRRRHRCGGALRRRRPGRRADPARPGLTRRAVARSRAKPDVQELVDRARNGEPRAVARLISLVENDSPTLREVAAALAPHGGRAQVVGLTGSPGVGKSTSMSALVGDPACGGSARRRAGGRPVVPVQRAARCSVTGCGCRTTPPTTASSSARWPRAVSSAGCRRRCRRRCACSTPPAATSCSSRPSGWGRRRSRSPRWPTPRCWCSRPASATASRRRRRACSRSPTSSSSTRPTGTAPTRWSATSRACSRSAGRHSEAGWWRPPIVRTVAARSEGMDDVVAAVEKHRAWMTEQGELERRRQGRAATEIEAIALGTLRRRMAGVHGSAALDEAAARVVAGKTDPYTAAPDALDCSPSGRPAACPLPGMATPVRPVARRRTRG